MTLSVRFDWEALLTLCLCVRGAVVFLLHKDVQVKIVQERCYMKMLHESLLNKFEQLWLGDQDSRVALAENPIKRVTQLYCNLLQALRAGLPYRQVALSNRQATLTIGICFCLHESCKRVRSGYPVKRIMLLLLYCQTNQNKARMPSIIVKHIYVIYIQIDKPNSIQ